LANNLLLGSGNAGKIKEIKFYLEYFNLFKNFKILDLSSFKGLGEPIENGLTFKENSIIKSTFFFNKTNYLLLFSGILMIIFGYFIMAYGEVNSFQSLTLAPIILFIGYIILIPSALIYKERIIKKD